MSGQSSLFLVLIILIFRSKMGSCALVASWSEYKLEQVSQCISQNTCEWAIGSSITPKRLLSKAEHGAR